MQKPGRIPCLIISSLMLIVPHALEAAGITGGVGSTVTDGGPNGNRDDTNTATTFDVSYQTFCTWLITGMQNQFPKVNFTFAGSGSNIGNLFAQVPAGDFTLLVPGVADSQYKPWVNTSTKVINPTGFGDSRPVTNQDAGGANFVLTYTPRPGTSDPTIVNFVQAYQDNINNAGFAAGRIDNLGDPTPFYSNVGIHGTGETQLLTKYANIPGQGMNAQGSTAWIVDIPYKCESFIPTLEGNPPPGAKLDCTGGPAPPDDEVLTSDVLMFQTFIESTRTIYYNEALEDPYSLTDNGGAPQTWDVLYGGVQWGFTYTNSDPVPPSVPEPSSIWLIGASVLFMCPRFISARRTQRTNSAPVRQSADR